MERIPLVATILTHLHHVRVGDDDLQQPVDSVVLEVSDNQLPAQQLQVRSLNDFAR